MAKNGHFFMEFCPFFYIFHRLQPYLWSKQVILAFHKQAKKVVISLFFTLDPPFMTGDGSKMFPWGKSIFSLIEIMVIYYGGSIIMLDT